MSTPSTFHAGFGSRLKNSQDLIQTIKALLLYNPIVDAIKIAIYEPFVSSVAAAMEPYNTAFKNFKQQENLTEDVFLLIVAITRKVREALLEIYLDSKEYHDYNELLDVITADNVSKNSYKRHHQPKETSPEAGTNPPDEDEDFFSVSQADRGSRLAKYTALYDHLKTDPNYTPNEDNIKLAALLSLKEKAGTELKALANLHILYINQLGIIHPLFDGPDSLHERAERAKMHIKRVYGIDSAEYKSLTGKSY